MRAVAVIPSRLGSTRLPEKALLNDTGKFLVEHVWERVKQSRRLARVVVATDHSRIAEAVLSFGGEVVMTRPDHATGTDRVAEVARGIDDEIVVNVQGDEPEIDAADVDLLVDALERDSECSIATLATPLRTEAELRSDSTVKVVFDAAGRALYFSRGAIPHHARAGREPPEAWKHRGVYAFRRPALLEVARLPASPQEKLERLEQLRWLHHGHRIRAVVTPRDGIGIDTPEDYRRFVESTRNGGRR